MAALAQPSPAPVAYPGNRVFHYVRRWWWRYLLGFLALIVATFAALLPPLIVQQAIDAIDERLRAGAFELGAVRNLLLAYAGAILGIAVIESALRYYSRFAVSGTARRIEYHLRDDLARHLMALDQGFYLRARTGDLMSRCTNDLQWVRDFIGPIVVEAGRAVFIIVLGFFFMLTIDVRLTLIAFAYLPFVVGLITYFESNIEKRFMEVQEQLAVLTDRSQENVSGMRAIKAYAQEDAEIAAWERENQEMRHRSMRLAIYQSGLLPVMIFLTAGGTLLVLWFGGHDVAAGRISIGQFVQFMLVLQILASQLMAAGWVLAGVQMGVVAMRRINEVLRTEPAVVDGPRVERLPSIRGEIEFRGVSVRFDGDPVLNDIHLHVPAGSTTAIVGGTGAGKTTLVNLLARLHDPDEGAVLLDGVDVRDLPLAELREAIGFVPQESFLFSESLRENISYGRPSASEAEYERALEISRLSNDLEQLDDGIQTLIGERGVTLSGGQKQRAAIARALLKDPPVLVLDDAMSHVDTGTEEEILRGLREFMRDRTTLVIAHRTSTLRSADRIVVLEQGRIAEHGTHAELIAHDGVYTRLYREQVVAELRQAEVDARLIDDGDGYADRHDGDGPRA